MVPLLLRSIDRALRVGGARCSILRQQGWQRKALKIYQEELHRPHIDALELMLGAISTYRLGPDQPASLHFN